MYRRTGGGGGGAGAVNVTSSDIMVRFEEPHFIYNVYDGVLCSRLFAV